MNNPAPLNPDFSFQFNISFESQKLALSLQKSLPKLEPLISSRTNEEIPKISPIINPSSLLEIEKQSGVLLNQSKVSLNLNDFDPIVLDSAQLTIQYEQHLHQKINSDIEASGLRFINSDLLNLGREGWCDVENILPWIHQSRKAQTNEIEELEDEPSFEIEELEDESSLKEEKILVVQANDTVERALKRMGGLQKKILVRIYREIESLGKQKVRWSPTDWFGGENITQSDRVNWSKCLNKLIVKRRLVVKDMDELLEVAANTSISYVSLNDAGREAAKWLIDIEGF